MLAVLIQNAFVGMATSSDDAIMLLNIPFPMNHVIIDPLALNLIDICLDNTLRKISCKLFGEDCLLKPRQNLASKIFYAQFQSSISHSVFNRSQPS